VPPPGRRYILGQLRAHRDHQVQVGQRPPGPFRRRRQRVEEHPRRLDEERVADPAVGQLTGEREVRRAERRDIDRNGGRPDKEQKIVFVRLREFERNMTFTLDQVKARAEA
jgi:hypothetical protein